MYGGNLFEFPDVMQYFSLLTSLDLSSKKISYVHPNVIPDRNNLIELRMNANQLTSIPQALQKLKHLHRLFISDNQIPIVEDHAFANLTELEILWLNGNPIKYVHPHAFADLKLTDLNLASTGLGLFAICLHRYICPFLITI